MIPSSWKILAVLWGWVEDKSGGRGKGAADAFGDGKGAANGDGNGDGIGDGDGASEGSADGNGDAFGNGSAPNPLLLRMLCNLKLKNFKQRLFQ